MPERIPCSVVILTQNEERNLAACLESLAAFDDVHVLDSGSTDATVDIATSRGARVAANAFAGFGQQRNWAHDRLPLLHDWVLHLDADERMTVALEREVAAVVAADDGRLAGYLLPERTLLRGRWLRYAGMYPRYQVRLVHRARMRYVDHGHGQRESSALPFGTLAAPYDHWAFSHGLEHWLCKHAGYARREAAQFVSGASRVSPLRLLTGTPLERHRALKQLGMRIPLRPLLRWLQVLIVKRGILDGRAGFEYARMLKLYEEMIDLFVLDAAARTATEGDRVRPADDVRAAEPQK